MIFLLEFYLSIIETPEEQLKFSDLYYGYKDLVIKVTYNILKDVYYAEDASQVAWMNIARNINKIKTDNLKMVKSFVICVAKNAAYNELKKNKKHAVLELKEYFQIEYEEDYIAKREEYILVRKAILEFPEIVRDVFCLHYINGLKVREIAEVLNRTQSSIKSILRRGRIRLEELFTKE